MGGKDTRWEDAISQVRQDSCLTQGCGHVDGGEKMD